ncbi:MAG: hypothetical protein ACON4Z_05170 [Planctomycetota bacterium]
MSLREGLGRRLLLAAVVAAAGIGGLAWAVEELEAGPKPTLRAQPDAAPGDRSGEPSAATYEPSMPAFAGQLGFELTALKGRLAVCDSVRAAPADVAPVVEVLPDGTLALRRGVPLAADPGPERPTSADGFGAAVVLSSGGLAALTPEARGALCGLLMRWFPERPVSRRRLQALGFRPDEEAWGRLLAWLP